ncbi:MAG: hypothetical protein NTY02_00425 [Acidobacteria bacterium]|nr:hypothetical protein [Acidobacteriota bacterium]
MRAIGICCLVGMVAVAGAACGSKKEEAKPAEQAAQQPGNAVQEAAKGMEQFAKSMEQLQKSPDGKDYQPVNFKDLQGFLPDVAGWEKEQPRGESMTAPVKFSQAETAYTKDDARIEVKIVDTAMSQMLTLPYQMFMMTGYSKESDNGYEKATKVGGYPGWEKWDSASKNAEVGIIVGQRFMVTLNGSNTDTKTVQGVVGKMDLGKLAGLK